MFNRIILFYEVTKLENVGRIKIAKKGAKNRHIYRSTNQKH